MRLMLASPDCLIPFIPSRNLCLISVYLWTPDKSFLFKSDLSYCLSIVYPSLLTTFHFNSFFLCQKFVSSFHRGQGWINMRHECIKICILSSSWGRLWKSISAWAGAHQYCLGEVWVQATESTCSVWKDLMSSKPLLLILLQYLGNKDIN